ncbi:unnamed protein product, partial [Phaeothamnion confervicola]
MLHWRLALNAHRPVSGIGSWDRSEDARLSALVRVYGQKWADVARRMPCRLPKQCRERYLNHLDPSLRKDEPWTRAEEELLMRLCGGDRPRWAHICRSLPGRSYNDVKAR